MEEKLKKFYLYCMLPQLVDPRIRYIIKRRGEFPYNDFFKHSSKRLDHLTSLKKKKIRANCFDFKDKCLFCEVPASTAREKKKNASQNKHSIRLISEPEFKSQLVAEITAHINIDKYKVMLDRISEINLVAVGARYHQACLLVFFKLPEKLATESKQMGRPRDTDISAQMNRIADYIRETGEDI
ncbi:unnamed protein product [Psylliodes chrysocephalus]|uniref:Uncharacterized protein n=1 Tax=Psylliodes chrysocephalus TaxID=3402493 RepID=A0A9P0CW10_9CUCU|nr:unnamed protein product [Psylliodes chrysocephala]